MPEYLIKTEDRQFKITSEKPLSEAEQRALALRYLGIQEQPGSPGTPPAADPSIEYPFPLNYMLPNKMSQITEADQARMQQEPWSLAQAGRNVGALGIGTVLPAAGAIGGSLIHPALGPVGEAIGGYAGRRLNVGLGLEQPGTLGDILSMAPPLVRGMGRALVPHIPGYSIAQHEMAAETARGIPEQVRPTQEAGPLYQQLEQINPTIPTQNVGQAAQEVLAEQLKRVPALRNREILKPARDLVVLTRNPSGQLPFDRVHANLQGLGEAIGEARAAGGQTYGALRKLYKAFYQDLEAAATSGTDEGATRLLQEANGIARKGFAASDLEDIINSGIKVRNDGLTQVSPGAIITRFQKKLRDDELFAKSFSPEEIAGIDEALQSLTHIKALPPVSGQQFGSGRVIGRGYLAKAGTEALGGGQIAGNIAGATAAYLPVLIAQGLLTKPGRALVMKLATTGELTTPKGMAALSGLISTGGRLATQRSESPSEEPPGLPSRQ